jgi:nitrate reductase alpha subunit
MPMLVRLVPHGDGYVPERLVRASDFDDSLGEANNPDWKTVMIDEQRRIRRAGRLGRVPLGPAGRRRQGQMEPARRDVEGRGAGAAAVVHGGA